MSAGKDLAGAHPRISPRVYCFCLRTIPTQMESDKVEFAGANAVKLSAFGCGNELRTLAEYLIGMELRQRRNPSPL